MYLISYAYEKKNLYLALALLIFCISCNKEEEPTKTERFISLLKSKNWDMTSYELLVNCGFGLTYPFKPTEEEAYFCSGVTNNTTSCQYYIGCEIIYEWKSYTVTFNDSHLSGTHKTHILSLEIDEEKCQHTAINFEEEITDSFHESFTFNEEDETMTTNFGNVWDMYQDKEVMRIKYSVKSWDEKKIVLEGTKMEKECLYTSNIILE